MKWLSPRSPARRRRCAAANISTPIGSRRCGARSRRRSRASAPRAASRWTHSSPRATAVGGRSAACISISPRTARTPSGLSPFSPLTFLARRAWRAAPCAARRGLARIRRRGREDRAPEAAGAGQPRQRELRLAEGDRRFRRDLPSAALDAARGDAAALRRRGAGAGGRRRADACVLVGRAARAGPRSRRRVGSQTPSLVGAAQLLDFQVEVSLDGEPLTARRDRERCSPRPTASRCCAANGSRWTRRG